MITLVEFLRARLDEAEQAARGAEQFHPSPWRLDPATQTTMESGRWIADAQGEGVLVANGEGAARLLVRHDPARVLRDVEAKRRIVDEHHDVQTTQVPDGNGGWYLRTDCATCAAGDASMGDGWPCSTLRLLALPYSGHPEYRAEWAP